MEVLLQPEPEIKFRVPLERPDAELIYGIIYVAQQSGFGNTTPVNTLPIYRSRVFTWYDDSDFNVYLKQDTVRQVSGFYPYREEGNFRYDYKTGAVTPEQRMEAKFWSYERLPFDFELKKKLGIPDSYGALNSVAKGLEITPNMRLEGRGTVVEVKLDTMRVYGGGTFRELEIEIGKGGDFEVFLDLAERIEQEMKLKRIATQKYETAIESIPEYREKFGLSPL